MEYEPKTETKSRDEVRSERHSSSQAVYGQFLFQHLPARKGRPLAALMLTMNGARRSSGQIKLRTGYENIAGSVLCVILSQIRFQSSLEQLKYIPIITYAYMK
jgi:hypothetical protein